MFRKIRTLAAMVIGAAALAAGSNEAKAQSGPPMDMSHIVQMNLAYDQQFFAALPGLAWQAALATPNDQPLPFNAMTISNSISSGMRTFEGNVANWHQNQAAQSAAVGRWTTGAVQGNWYYGNGQQTYVLPYTQDMYYRQNGYMNGGYMPGGDNFYQMYYGR